MNVFGLGTTHGFDAQQAVSALLSVATVLFLMSFPPGFAYRRAARLASITIYCIVLAAIIVWVVLWLLGLSG